MPVLGSLCPAIDPCLCPGSSRGCYRVLGVGWGPRTQFFAVPSLPGLKCLPRVGETDCHHSSGGRGRRLSHMIKSCYFQATGPGRGTAKPPLNVLTWLTTLPGAGSGSWERVSGFSPWDRVNQAPLAIFPIAVHTQDRLGQGRGPAGHVREPCSMRPRPWL